MSQANINLTANIPARVETKGRFFMLVSLTGVDSIELRFDVHGQGDRNDETILTARKGFKLRLSANRFDSVTMRATGAAAVSYVISDNDVDFDFVEGAAVNATIVAPDPVPVSNDRGSVANPVNVVGVTVNDAPATAINNLAHVACGPVAVVVKPANANSRRARFTNFGPDAVALGGAGITWATRCVVLEAGDTWVEDNAANLAWSAITDAGLAATVGVQEVVN